MATWQKNAKNFELRTREDAAAAGLTYYFTGKPCKHGHTAPRYVTTGACLGCLEKWKHLKARSPFSHDLVPYAPGGLWRSKRFTLEQLKGLDQYVQQCVEAYAAHVLPPLCKACDGTLLMIDPATKGWVSCEACAEPVPSTAGAS